MTVEALDPHLRNRLTRFLHTGIELPKYFPGCWTAHKYFESDKLPVLNEIFEKYPNNVEVVQIIMKACKDGWYTRFDTIAFALAKCIMLGNSTVREATYNAATEVCITPEQLLLFNKFTRLLKTGNGHGWCRSVKAWYTSKEPMELAKEVSRVRARHGRSHKTLLRKSHMKVPDNDYARDAVVKYTIFGLKHAKELLVDKEGTKEIFDYIQKVEDMRHCEDPTAAALMVSNNNFTLDHVPGHLLTSQDVWNALLPHMPLEEILYHIQRIHNMGFLANNSATTAILVSLLNNQDIVKKAKVTPLYAYITLCNYQKKSRPMYKPIKYEKAKVLNEKELRRRGRQIFDSKSGLWQWTTTKRHPKEIKNWGIDQPPNPAIVASLTTLVDQCWHLTRPTNARYLITMDMRHHMFKGRHFCKNYVLPKKAKKTKTNQPASGAGDADPEKPTKKHLLAECFYNKDVTPGHAAIIMAMYIMKREKNCSLAVFAEEGLHIVKPDRNFASIDEAEYMLRRALHGRVQMDAPIDWATKTKQKFDVFVNMVDRSTRVLELSPEKRAGRGPAGRYGPPPPPDSEQKDHCPVRALENYRIQSGIKDAKLIVMNLASHRVGTTDGTHEGVLDIIGIDEHVPKLMDAFVCGQFK